MYFYAKTQTKNYKSSNEELLQNRINIEKVSDTISNYNQFIFTFQYLIVNNSTPYNGITEKNNPDALTNTTFPQKIDSQKKKIFFFSKTSIQSNWIIQDHRNFSEINVVENTLSAVLILIY
eukprot:TRINITY_DN2489_c0_g1_i7.p7 TRINITY_DN2489_c0_g1~~TRINITY_DN2489_c0_g1_i7.p7  ORF type:complete len:121 (+),score=0.96 TRINITY_DN2489_c0_g1_i7:985-1347(+)